MNYLALGATIFVAVLLVGILRELYVLLQSHLILRKQRKEWQELNDKLIERYASVDEVDDVVKEWMSE